MAVRWVDSAEPVRTDSFGLSCWHGRAVLMSAAHRHDDIEVNLASGGGLDYLIGGASVRVEPYRLAMFWASLPHQLVAADPGASMSWLCIPIGMFLSWPVDEQFRLRVLRGQPIQSSVPAADAVRFDCWESDLDATAGADRAAIATLEIEAWVRRLALAATGTIRGQSPAPGSRTRDAGVMAAFIAAHVAEPITVADVAAAVSLHPHYAMAVFKESFGLSIGSYLTGCRVAEAQRLLITSDRSVADVGLAAGFASQSRFYAAFRGTCGVAPAAYRRAHQRLSGQRVVHPRPGAG